MGLVGAVDRCSARCALPEDVHSVATYLLVAGYEREAIDIGLGYEKAVEGVTMMHGKRADTVGVAGGDWE